MTTLDKLTPWIAALMALVVWAMLTGWLEAAK